jgi:hypothetical protein
MIGLLGKKLDKHAFTTQGNARCDRRLGPNRVHQVKSKDGKDGYDRAIGFR